MVNLLFEDDGNWDGVARLNIVWTGCGQEIEIQEHLRLFLPVADLHLRN